MMKTTLLILCVYFTVTSGKVGFGPTDQDWGYVTVRKGAHLFWWLHYTTAEVADPTDVPLVIWLQGGPGASSTGYGNIGEIGPLDEHSKERKYAWTKLCNVLFVDNPVGTGFSYVEDSTKYTTNNTQIAEDFLVFLKDFYRQFQKFNETPLYIFSESYGGKMTVEIALLLHEAQKSGMISSNFKGIGLGDPWISPADTVMTWAPYLKNLGILDDKGADEIHKEAEQIAEAIEAGDSQTAIRKWGALSFLVELKGSNVNFYNVLIKVKPLWTNKPLNMIQGTFEEVDEIALNQLMNNEVKKALNLNRTWTSMDNNVNNALRYDFMKPVTEIVEKLLNETELEIVVYNGQLDLIVDSPGTIKWINDLKWNGKKKWNTTGHEPFTVNKYVEGFYKNVERLTFYWVSRAGHMVPYDNPEAMDFILRSTIGENTQIKKNTI